MFYDESMMSDMLKKKMFSHHCPFYSNFANQAKKKYQPENQLQSYINLVSRAFSVLVNFGTIGWNNASLHPPQ